jgi:heme-degrading monooxygenase HmoA
MDWIDVADLKGRPSPALDPNTYRVTPPTTGQLRTSRRNDDRSNLEGRRPQARRDAYAQYMQQTGVAGYAKTPGNRGVWMLRRNVDDRTEFMMFTLWDSLEAVKAFAGDDYETAVFYPEDERFPVERDRTAVHYEVDTHTGPNVA